MSELWEQTRRCHNQKQEAGRYKTAEASEINTNAFLGKPDLRSYSGMMKTRLQRGARAAQNKFLGADRESRQLCDPDGESHMILIVPTSVRLMGAETLLFKPLRKSRAEAKSSLCHVKSWLFQTQEDEPERHPAES